MPFLAPLAIVIVTLLGWSGYQEYKDPIVGAVTPFTSKQLAPDPQNGNCLTTNGSINAWSADCGEGGGGGGGGLASSTPWTAGYLAYVVNNSTVRGVATTSLTASSPLSLSQPISVIGSSASAVSIQNAAADGSTKGAASFTANDFDASSGNISIDYTNAQKASGSLAGFLTSTDWNTFNNKLGSYDAWTHPATGQSATTSLIQLLGKASTTQLSANNAFFNFFQATSTTATSSIAGDFFVGASTGDNKVRITADRVFSASNSVGGLLNLTNTNNTGPALVLYTNNGGTSAGNLMNVRCDNTAMTHDCVKIDHDGAGDGLAIAATAAASNALSLSNTGVDHTLNASYTGSTAQKGAMNLTSTNTGGSVFQVTGRPSGLGVGKITHDSTGDANSSLLSLDASASGYLGQGIFLDSSGGSWGTGLKILNLRANGVEKLTLTTDGLLTVPSASSTLFSTSYASSTLYYGAGLTNCNTENMLTWTDGRFGCEADTAAAGGGTFPFTPSTTYNTAVNATSTPIHFTAGLYASTTVTFGNAGQAPFRWDGPNGRFGLGTLSPSELLHLSKSSGNFTTIRYDSGNTQGYFFAYDGDNSVNIGSNSDAQMNLRQNNSTRAYLDTNGLFTVQNTEGNKSFVTLIAPSADPQEATFTTVLDHGGGNKEFLDITTEDYGTDFQHSINSAATGTGKVLPISFRFWRSLGGAGGIASEGVYTQTWLPNGTIGFGVSTSTAGTNGASSLLYAASSTATNLLKLDTGAGTTKFVVTSTGLVGVSTSSPYAPLSVVGPGGVVAENYNATNTSATSTLQKTSISGAISILGEYFTNFTNYVRSLFTGGTGIALSGGDISFDCSEVEGTGINCSGENITLDATGDWTGTLDGFNGFGYPFPSAATSTLITFSGGITASAGTVNLSAAAVKEHTYSSFAYSTTTAWTGTTTIPLGPAYTAESWSGVKCFTDTGTVNVSFYDGTNRMDLLNASTTVGTFGFSTNNTFTASEKRYVDIGTPASTPTKVSCTVDKIVNN